MSCTVVLIKENSKLGYSKFTFLIKKKSCLGYGSQAYLFIRSSCSSLNFVLPAPMFLVTDLTVFAGRVGFMVDRFQHVWLSITGPFVCSKRVFFYVNRAGVSISKKISAIQNVFDPQFHSNFSIVFLNILNWEVGKEVHK